MPKISATPVTYILIALCVLCFIPVAADAFPAANPWALFLPDNPQHRSWQYLSSMFMHGNTSNQLINNLHLLVNMFALWMFGTRLEYYWGSARFLLFYLTCGIIGGVLYSLISEYQLLGQAQALLQMGMSPEGIERLLETRRYTEIPGLSPETVSEYYWSYHGSTVGASGAIYGILAGYAICFPNHKLAIIFIPVPVAAKYFVPVILLIDLLSGITGFSIFGINIAHFAHLSGAAVGFVLALVVNFSLQRRYSTH